MAESNPLTAFFVTALTNDPFVFYSSNVDSGYSVDNTPPPPPQGFVGAYASQGVALHWEPGAVADLSYRSMWADRAASPANLKPPRRPTPVRVARRLTGDYCVPTTVDTHNNEATRRASLPGAWGEPAGLQLDLDPDHARFGTTVRSVPRELAALRIELFGPAAGWARSG